MKDLDQQQGPSSSQAQSSHNDAEVRIKCIKNKSYNKLPVFRQGIQRAYRKKVFQIYNIDGEHSQPLRKLNKLQIKAKSLAHHSDPPVTDTYFRQLLWAGAPSLPDRRTTRDARANYTLYRIHF